MIFMKKGAKKKKRPVAKKAKTTKKKTKASSGAKGALKKSISDSLKLITKIRTKGKASQDAVDKEQKKMFKSSDPTEKLLCYFQIEGLKIDSFAKIEKEYKALSLLLNESYKHAHKIGGIVWDDFLNICADLSKGIDLDFMEKTMKKMLGDLKLA